VHQASQCDGSSPVGFDPVAGLLGNQGGRHDPADLAFCGERAVEPGATRAGCRDKAEVRALGWQPTEPCSDVRLSCPSIAKGDELGVVFFGDRVDRHRVFLYIQTDVECARLLHD
jgi:hypothetical protein